MSPVEVLTSTGGEAVVSSLVSGILTLSVIGSIVVVVSGAAVVVVLEIVLSLASVVVSGFCFTVVDSISFTSGSAWLVDSVDSDGSETLLLVVGSVVDTSTG